MFYLGIEYGLLAGWENEMFLTVTSIGWRVGAKVERYVQCVPVLFSIPECCLQVFFLFEILSQNSCFHCRRFRVSVTLIL